MTHDEFQQIQDGVCDIFFDVTENQRDEIVGSLLFDEPRLLPNIAYTGTASEFSTHLLMRIRNYGGDDLLFQFVRSLARVRTGGNKYVAFIQLYDSIQGIVTPLPSPPPQMPFAPPPPFTSPLPIVPPSQTTSPQKPPAYDLTDALSTPVQNKLGTPKGSNALVSSFVNWNAPAWRKWCVAYFFLSVIYSVFVVAFGDAGVGLSVTAITGVWFGWAVKQHKN